MKRVIITMIFLLFILTLAFSVSAEQIQIDSKSTTNSSIYPDIEKEKEIKVKMASMQIPFIKNESQIEDSSVKYYTNTFAGTVFISDSGITYALKNEKDSNKESLVKEQFIGARSASVESMTASGTKVNYFGGSDKENWKSDMDTYQEVGYKNLYDHITLQLKAYGDNIEKVFLIEQGGDPGSIYIKVDGANKIGVNDKGELTIENDAGTLKMTRPIAYQEFDSERVDVEVAYELRDKAYGFKVGDYDKNYPLIIDPLLASTFLGGNRNEWVNAISIDSSGNIFVTGFTESTDFPVTPGTYNTSQKGGGDIFVSKFNGDLTELLSSTLIGGSKKDTANALVIDEQGNIFIAGSSESSDYPVTEKAYNKMHIGKSNAFVTKLNNELNQILSSTFIGGENEDTVAGMILDSSGNVIISGYTSSIDYPTTERSYSKSHSGGKDVFVSKLSNDLSHLIVSTLIGGKRDELAQAMVIDSSGNIFVTGYTNSFDYPTTEGTYQRMNMDSKNTSSINVNWHDVFVSKLDNNLTKLIASTYIGGKGDDVVQDMSIDPGGNIFIIGYHLSDYPVTEGAYSKTGSIFISKFNNELNKLLASTFFNGGSTERKNKEQVITVDSQGDVFVAGFTTSNYSPISEGVAQKKLKDKNFLVGDTAYYVFLSRFDNNLSRLLASTLVGGNGNDMVYGIVFDTKGNIFFAGHTNSSDYPTTGGAFDKARHERSYFDVYISKLTDNLDSTQNNKEHSYLIWLSVIVFVTILLIFVLLFRKIRLKRRNN